MTTPTTANTPVRLIQQAYFDSGRSSEGSGPNGEQLADGMNRLNDLINLWQTQGLKLWLVQDYPITLTAGVNQYNLSATSPGLQTRPTRAFQGYVLQASNSIRRPLVGPISRDEWTRLSQVVQQGPISSFFIDKQQTSLNVYGWLTPDTTEAANSLHIILQEQVQNFVGVTDTMNFPTEWAIALRWGLADELATGQPESVQQRCSLKAQTYRTVLEDWDVEDASTMFSPDQRIQTGTSSFI